MPVEDHPVHPKVRIDSTFRYGCHNREPYAEGYYAPDRHYFPDGRFEVRNVSIKRVSTDACQYDRSQHDAACEGCKHKEQDNAT